MEFEKKKLTGELGTFEYELALLAADECVEIFRDMKIRYEIDDKTECGNVKRRLIDYLEEDKNYDYSLKECLKKIKALVYSFRKV